jgi:hypothetical protein
MRLLFFLSLFVATSVSAQLYRSIDAQGHITFSDQPDDNAEEVILNEPTIYTPPVIPEVSIPSAEEVETEIEKTEPEVPAYQVSIVSPTQNEAFWSNDGKVVVTASVTPELNMERGDKLQFTLDGKLVGSTQASLTHEIENVERGSHILMAIIVDKSGSQLARSQSRLFHVHKRSIAQ